MDLFVIPFIQGLDNVIIQHENAWSHTAAITRQFLEDANNNILPYLARLLYLSQLEQF